MKCRCQRYGARQDFALEDAIGSHACSLEASTPVTNDNSSRVFTLSPFDAANVVATLKVPAGDYVVRWRWDAEQSPQIWSGCGDITIE
jgi:hypothetical protein